MIRFSIPILFSNLANAVFQLIDTFWIGYYLGDEAVAAATFAGSILFFIQALMIGLNAAMASMVSRKKGENDLKGMKELLHSFGLLWVLSSSVVSILGYIGSPFLAGLLGLSESMNGEFAQYLGVMILGSAITSGFMFVSTVQRAMGDSKTPLIFLLFFLALNGVLTPLFIGFMGFGLMGAAYSQLISQTIALFWSFMYFKRRSALPVGGPYRVSGKMVGSIMSLSIPNVIQMFVLGASASFVYFVASTHGDDVLAGFGAAQRIENFLMILSLTFGSAVTSMAGQNIGAGNWARVSEIIKRASILVAGISIVFGAVLFCSSSFLLRMLLHNEEAVAFGGNYLRTLSFFYVFSGLFYVMEGVLKASGSMGHILKLYMIHHLLLKIGFIWLAGIWMEADGISIGIGVALLAAALLGKYVVNSILEKKGLTMAEINTSMINK